MHTDTQTQTVLQAPRSKMVPLASGLDIFGAAAAAAESTRIHSAPSARRGISNILGPL